MFKSLHNMFSFPGRRELRSMGCRLEIMADLEGREVRIARAEENVA